MVLMPINGLRKEENENKFSEPFGVDREERFTICEDHLETSSIRSDGSIIISNYN